MSGYGALVDAAWAKAVELGLDQPSKVGLDITEVQQMIEAALGGLTLPAPGLHSYMVQQWTMRVGYPLRFSDGERVVAVMGSEPVPGTADMVVTVLVELP